MFRLPRRRTFEAICPPLGSPLGRPLGRPLGSHLHLFSSRHVHAMQVPFSGPPTYDTVARRFSSYPNPLAFFVNKRQQEARDRGGFIDIHDVGGMNSNDYDVLITDIDNKKLRSEISEAVGIQYLVKATEADANKVVEVGHGYVYGPKFHTIFPFVVSHDDKAHWVFFVVDTGAPLTYLSVQASELLGIEKDQYAIAKVAGYPLPVHMSPPNSHFAEINLLGADFCKEYNVTLSYSPGNQKVKLYFGKMWEVIRKPKL